MKESQCGSTLHLPFSSRLIPAPEHGRRKKGIAEEKQGNSGPISECPRSSEKKQPSEVALVSNSRRLRIVFKVHASLM